MRGVRIPRESLRFMRVRCSPLTPAEPGREGRVSIVTCRSSRRPHRRPLHRQGRHIRSQFRALAAPKVCAGVLRARLACAGVWSLRAPGPGADGSPGDDVPGDLDASVASETGVASEAGVDVGTAGDDAALEGETPQDEGGLFLEPAARTPARAGQPMGVGVARPHAEAAARRRLLPRWLGRPCVRDRRARACVTCGPELSCPRGVCE